MVLWPTGLPEAVLRVAEAESPDQVYHPRQMVVQPAMAASPEVPVEQDIEADRPLRPVVEGLLVAQQHAQGHDILPEE